MEKGVASEMILTVGILIATIILLLQIRSVFNLQQKIAQEEVLYEFKDDMESMIDKFMAVTGDVYFNYQPRLKKYVIEAGDESISIYNKISRKNASFVVDDAELSFARIEDSESICITKLLSRETSTVTIDIKQGKCFEVKKPLYFNWPVDDHSSITRCFGYRYDVKPGSPVFYTAIDISIPFGTDVKASADGKVINILNSDGSLPVQSKGNFILLEHEDQDGTKYYTEYQHLQCDGVLVGVGDTVNAGQVIGKTGGSDSCKGDATGEYLYFQIMKTYSDVYNSVNPCLYLQNCPCSTTCENYRQRNSDRCPLS